MRLRGRGVKPQFISCRDHRRRPIARRSRADRAPVTPDRALIARLLRRRTRLRAGASQLASEARRTPPKPRGPVLAIRTWDDRRTSLLAAARCPVSAPAEDPRVTRLRVEIAPKTVVLVLSVFAAIWILGQLTGVLAVVTVALVLVGTFDPMVTWMERRGLGNKEKQ